MSNDYTGLDYQDLNQGREPDPITVENFIAWVKETGKEDEYYSYSSIHCANAQFHEAMDVEYTVPHPSHEGPVGLIERASCVAMHENPGKQTFGDVVKILEEVHVKD